MTPVAKVKKKDAAMILKPEINDPPTQITVGYDGVGTEVCAYAQLTGATESVAVTAVAMAAAVCLRWHVRSCGVQRRDDFLYAPPLCGVVLYRKSSFSSSGPRKLIAGKPSIYQ